jgi:hypothetical protein
MTTHDEYRNGIRDALLCRAMSREELAAKFGLHRDVVGHMLAEIADSGEPIEGWCPGGYYSDSGDPYRYHIVFPQGRVCRVCGCGLSIYNPCDVCNCHGGGCYPDATEVEL